MILKTGFSFNFSSFGVKMHLNTTVIAILYWCGTWSLILKEEQRLRVFQDKLLKKISATEGVESS
jgi:hypothetical protein